MKEILFRGQTRRKGEKVYMNGNPVPSNWVYGGIFPQNRGGDYAVHARYQYYGKLMVSSVTGSAFANKGEKKVLTNIKLKYNTSKHSRAGSFWFERMKADRLNDILSGAIKIAGGK